DFVQLFSPMISTDKHFLVGSSSGDVSFGVQQTTHRPSSGHSTKCWIDFSDPYRSMVPACGSTFRAYNCGLPLVSVVGRGSSTSFRWRRFRLRETATLR